MPPIQLQPLQQRYKVADAVDFREARGSSDRLRKVAERKAARLQDFRRAAHAAIGRDVA
jgi:hypothetical protein